MSSYPVLPGFTVSTVKVTVVYGEYATYTVTWPAQAGAIGYNVLGSPSPITQNVIQSGTGLPVSPQSFTLQLPLVPQDVVYHFWVQAIFPGPVTTYIQNDPATIFDNIDPFLTSPGADPLNPALSSCITNCASDPNLPFEQMAFMRDEIRRRHLSVLMNDGESFELYLRRWAGVPCVCLTPQAVGFTFSDTVVYQVNSSGETVMVPPIRLISSMSSSSTADITVDTTENFSALGYVKIDEEVIQYSSKNATTLIGITRASAGTTAQMHTIQSSLDPNTVPGYNLTSGRCEQCYGTGIAGGYWPGIDITARYGESPTRTIAFVSRAAELQHSFPSWTLWLPRLHEHDLLIRTLTGERFEVVGISESRWRGVTLSQRFSTNKMQPGDIRYKVTDAGIQAGLDAAHTDNPVKFDMTIFS